MSPDLPRRPVLRALGGAAVGSLVVGAAPGLIGAGADAESPGLTTADFTRRADGRWRSRPVAVPSFALVAFTWHGALHPPRLALRVRREGRWRPARAIRRLHDLPDGDTEGRAGAAASQPLWLKGADHVEVVVDSLRDVRHLRLVVIDATPIPQDARPLVRGRADLRGAPRLVVEAPPAPRVLSRAAWDADESLRDGSPRYNETIKQVHVHHTDTDNGYSRDDVPGIIRAIYRYHTRSLGWSDIGYNFLVDRFGRLWEGRAGGVARPVRGAHTLGFNATSVGVSMIGNYEKTEPAGGAIEAIVDLAAWKLGLYGRRADADTSVTSEGSDKFASGEVVVLPTIDGHRDTNDTACPGSALYPHLPAIRTRTQALLDGHTSSGQQIVVSAPFELHGTPVPGRVLTVKPGAFTPTDCAVHYTWSRGTSPAGAGDDAVYTVSKQDAGQRVSVLVTLEKAGYADASVTLTIPLPVQALSSTTLTATRHDTAVTVIATVTVNATAGSTTPTGLVAVILGDQHHTLTLAAGRATVTFQDVPADAVALSAGYRGDVFTVPSCVATTVAPST